MVDPMKRDGVQRLSREEWLVAVYAAVIVFITYATIFGFRKTYTVATFEGETLFGVGFKELLVVTQALGYLSSKFFGIKFIAELRRFRRWKIIFLLVGISWTAWLFFALIPRPYNIVFLFLNGFPLGLLWGVVFSYIEGRRSTDLIGAALAVSFIFSSGIVKSLGQIIMLRFGITE